MDKKKQVRKKRRYKKFKDMTRPQQLKLIRSLSIVGIVFVTVIVIISMMIFNHLSRVTASSESEGDIFSHGFDRSGESSIIIEDAAVPAAVRESMNRAAEEQTDMSALYASMKRDNPDFAGYLRIDGTSIDYPVMYSPEEPERYLDRDFEINKSVKGLPFIDARCSLDNTSDNLIIYAHNMKDGSMFGNLEAYREKDYANEHRIIQFDTPEGTGTYEVMYAFYDRVYYEDERDFRFYDFIDAKDKDDFDGTMSILASKSIYNMKKDAQYGDKFITLVTCSYQEDEGRFVVIAKKV